LITDRIIARRTCRKTSAGFFMSVMIEPQNKRVAAFVDGQNLFYAAKMAFGYGFPNFDPIELAKLVCKQQGNWTLVKLCFYTGTRIGV